MYDKTFFQASNTSPLSDGYFLSLMQNLNLPRSQEFCTILDRLESNLTFTQSLSEYFATDDMLEPAAMVISDALRQSPDLGKGLWGRSVAANALLYRHRASPNDHEFNSGRQSIRTNHFTPRVPTSSQMGGFGRARTPQRAYVSSKYPKGTCFHFQNRGFCLKQGCEYDHACCKCFSKTHGKDSCPNN